MSRLKRLLLKVNLLTALGFLQRKKATESQMKRVILGIKIRSHPPWYTLLQCSNNLYSLDGGGGCIIIFPARPKAKAFIGLDKDCSIGFGKANSARESFNLIVTTQKGCCVC